MKQRNVMAVLLLSIITLGVYDLFWLVKVKKELNATTDIHTPTIWLLLAPYLAFLIPIGLLIALGSSSHANNIALVNIFFGLMYALAILVVLPVTFYWFFKFSKAVNHYTHGELNTAVTFLLLWMLRFIGLAIIQDKFNDMMEAGSTGGEQQPVPAVVTTIPQAQSVSETPVNQVPVQEAATLPPTGEPTVAHADENTQQPPASQQ
jgi:hypothetical protein